MKLAGCTTTTSLSAGELRPCITKQTAARARSDMFRSCLYRARADKLELARMFTLAALCACG